MGGRNEPSLELGWRQIYTATEHPEEERLEPPSIRTFGRFPVGHRVARKEESKHRSNPIYCNAWRHLRGELRRPPFDRFIDLGMRFQVAQHRDPGADGQRIAGKRTGLIN